MEVLIRDESGTLLEVRADQVSNRLNADVGGGDEVKDLAFSHDGEMLAIAIGRSGNGGTNGGSSCD